LKKIISYIAFIAVIFLMSGVMIGVLLYEKCLGDDEKIWEN